MSQIPVGVILAGVFLILIIIEIFLSDKHPFKKAFLNTLIGICSLILTNLVSVFTGVCLPISILSLTIASLGGIPGVAMMIILNNIT